MWDHRIEDAAPEAVFVPEQYLPSQLARARRDSLLCGEKALLLAVVEDAIRCLDGRTPARARAARDAERWVCSEDHAWPFSFVNVCAYLDVDVERLRAALLARRSRRDGPARRLSPPPPPQTAAPSPAPGTRPRRVAETGRARLTRMGDRVPGAV